MLLIQQNNNNNSIISGDFNDDSYFKVSDMMSSYFSFNKLPFTLPSVYSGCKIFDRRDHTMILPRNWSQLPDHKCLLIYYDRHI